MMTEMTAVGFRCRLPYGSEVSRLRKFFDDADTIKVVFGEAGIAFASTSRGDECYYLAMIHSCDIYSIYVNKESWPDGGIVRVMSAAALGNFLRGKESNSDIEFQIDEHGTTLTLAIIAGTCRIRESLILLSTPDMMYELPKITEANSVIPVNVYKKLCSNLAKASSEIRIESQKDGVRFVAGSNDRYTYGDFKEGLPETNVSYVKSTCFVRSTKVNVGNSKASNTGIYIRDDLPLMIKIRLGMIEFRILAKRYFTQ